MTQWPDSDTLDTDSNFSWDVTAQQAGIRLDRLLAQAFPQFSRTRLQGLITGGDVTINDALITAPAYKVRAGDHIEFVEPPPILADPLPESIPLDIVYEDADLLVINKDADMVVHPAPGHTSGTLVNALLAHCGDTLSGIGGVKRPGIVHRLDRGTSGLMLVAKHDAAHVHLQAQLSDRSLGRIYHAIAFQIPMPPAGTIDKPIGRHPTHRLKMTIGGAGPRAAITHYKTLQKFSAAASLIECRLATGRTHQIRVHLAALGHPLLGDPLYGAPPTAWSAALKREGYADECTKDILALPRQALHAHEIHFTHPRSGQTLSFTAAPPDDMQQILTMLIPH